VDLTTGIAPPPAATIGPPYSLEIVDSVLLRSALTPEAQITLRWRPPVGVVPSGYEIQWATNSTFTAGVGGKPATTTPEPISGLATGRAYWFRVRALSGSIVSAWSNVVTVTTLSDLTPPDPVTGAALTWGPSGDQVVSWTNPASPNFARVRVRWRQAGGGGGVLAERTTGGTATILGVDAQRLITGFPRVGYQVEIVALSSSGIESAAVILNATWTRLGTPTVTADFAGPDLILTAATQAGAMSYTWTVVPSPAGGATTQSYPGQARNFTFSYAENLARFTTARPTLAWTCTPVDALGLGPVTPASGTATNGAPAATTISLGPIGVSGMRLTIAPSPARDLRDYRVRLYRDGVLQRTLFARETTIDQQVDEDGSWQADVTVYDVFDQPSPVATSPAVVIDALTLAELRVDLVYSDSIGTNATALRDRMADGGVTTAITYTNAAWNWTQAERYVEARFRNVELAATAGTTFYLATSLDGVTWEWWAGPLSGGQLVKKTSQAQAQANPISIGVGGAVTLFTLASVVFRCRFVRLWHTHPTNGSYVLSEFFPRALGQFSDLEAESIRGFHFSGDAFTGQVMTGATIQTALPGNDRLELTTATGLRSVDASGSELISLTPGGGLTIAGDAVGGPARSIRMVFGGRETRISRIGGLYAIEHEVSNTDPGRIALVTTNASTGQGSAVHISRDTLGIYGNSVTVSGAGLRVGTPAGSVAAGNLSASGTITAAGSIRADTALATYGALNVGDDTLGGNAGEIRTLRATSGTNDVLVAAQHFRRSTGTPAAGIGLQTVHTVQDAAGVDRNTLAIRSLLSDTSAAWKARAQLLVADSNNNSREALRLEGTGSAAALGVLGAAAVPRQTITGSRSGGAALQSVIALLVAFGFGTDSTTA